MKWAQVWRWRSALAYTVGAWTVFGYVLYTSNQSIGKRREEEEEEKQPVLQEKRSSGNETASTVIISEDGLKETFIYNSPGRSFSVVTTSTYKPNFVPYTTRLYNYVQSFFDDNGGKEK